MKQCLQDKSQYIMQLHSCNDGGSVDNALFFNRFFNGPGLNQGDLVALAA